MSKSTAPSRIAWGDFDGVLFDLDGVITPTAEMHERAWCRLFADHHCTREDYLAHIDGRPRFDGVRTFLAARGITLPEGTTDDAPGTTTIGALGNLKNEIFNDLLDAEGIEVYPGSRLVLDRLELIGMPSAIVSSSRNARRVLEAAGLGERFEIVVDGEVALEHDLPGKPAPDTFLYAARLLGVDPARTIVVEDAISGVAAGAAGGFGLVLGVDRGGHRADLLASGADLVVDDLGDTVIDGEAHDRHHTTDDIP